MQSLQTTLAAGAALAAVVGIFFALLGRRGSIRRAEPGDAGGPGIAGIAAVGAILLFALTLLARPPFSPGNTMGWGFLAGATLGLLALYLTSTGGEESWQPDAVGLISAAVLAPAAMLVAFRGDPTAPLGGCTLGALFVACLARSLKPARLIGLEPFALAAATLFAGTRLGMEHFPRNAPNDPAGGYWAAPALLLAVGALALSLMPGRRERSGASLPLLFGGGAGIVSVAGAALLHAKLLPDLAWLPPLYGLLGFAFLLLILSGEPPASSNPDSRPLSLALGAIFLTLAVSALAFQGQQAYGQVLALLPAAFLVCAARLSGGVARETVAGPLGTGAWTLALLLTLHRVFVEGTGRGRPLDFQNHYDVVALLLGLCGTFALLSYAQADAERVASYGGTDSPMRLLPRTLLLGFCVTAAPLAVALTWGIRSTSAYLIGLPFAEAAWMLLVAWNAGGERRKVFAAAPHLFLVATALVAVQFTPFVLDLELKRNQRIGVIGGLALVALIAIFATSIRRDRPTLKEARNESPV